MYHCNYVSALRLDGYIDEYDYMRDWFLNMGVVSLVMYVVR